MVDPSQTVASGTLSSGAKLIRQNSAFTVQLDFHSLDKTTAADMAETISTAFRDAYAVEFFGAISDEITPLYADDPRYLPFQNENQQFEQRWVVEARLQVNQTIAVPSQFADSATVTAISVEAGPPYP